MARPTERQTRKAQRSAAFAVLCVTAFSTLFVACVMVLNVFAPSAGGEDSVFISRANVPNEPFYVLLIGSDSRKGTALYTGRETDHSQLDQYADILTLARIEPNTYDITLVSIPRDTVIEGDDDKINSSLVGDDPARVVAAVERLTGIDVGYYMMTTFISFQNLVNALGGVDVDVPVTITTTDPASGKKVTVKAGKGRHLDGAEALVLARARKEYGDDQEALRQVNVRALERAIIEKVLAYGADLDVKHILSAVEHDTYTDMSLPTMGALVASFVEHAGEVSIYDCTGPYKGAERASDGQWVVDGDEETWTQLMELVDLGLDPAGFIEAPAFGS